MSERNLTKPDITITLDSEGVIRSAVSSQELEGERLDDWRGRAWEDTVEPAINGEIMKMIEAVRRSGDSSCFRVRQRFPSGRELPIEYTTISLGRRAGFVAVGRNLEAIAELQARLLAVQQAREQDYWKLREIETRYRLVFDASSEAVALVRTTNLRVVEANLAAAKRLGLVPGGEFMPELSARDRKALEMMLQRVREQGRAPGIALHPGGFPTPCSVRASMVMTQSDAYYLFQISAMGGELAAPGVGPCVEDIVQRLPDGFVIVDRAGSVRLANHTFLDLAQVGAESAIIGENLKRWLSRPGADISVILGMVQKRSRVTMMTTLLEGELGLLTEVELSAVGDTSESPDFVGILLRDVTIRTRGTTTPSVSASDLDAPAISLEALVKRSTEAIERSTISSALERFQWHRTAAAKYLGLSRQSLHAKLKKYDFTEK
jgi:transcriptional regulator PpsR